MSIYNKTGISTGKTFEFTLPAGACTDAMKFDISASAYGTAAQNGHSLASLYISVNGVSILSQRIDLIGALTELGQDTVADVSVEATAIRVSDIGCNSKGTVMVEGAPVAFIPAVSRPAGFDWKKQQTVKVWLTTEGTTDANLTTVGVRW